MRNGKQEVFTAAQKQFDRGNRKWRTLFGLCHVRQVVLYVCFTEFLWQIANVTIFLNFVNPNFIKSAQMCVPVTLWLSAWLACILLLFVGIRKEKPVYNLFHIIIQCVSIGVGALLLALSLLILTECTDNFFVEAFYAVTGLQTKQTIKMALFLLVSQSGLLPLLIWGLIISVTLYHFLEAKQLSAMESLKTTLFIGDTPVVVSAHPVQPSILLQDMSSTHKKQGEFASPDPRTLENIPITPLTHMGTLVYGHPQFIGKLRRY